jgi:hypothetical protein
MKNTAQSHEHRLYDEIRELTTKLRKLRQELKDYLYRPRSSEADEQPRGRRAAKKR